MFSDYIGILGDGMDDNSHEWNIMGIWGQYVYSAK